MTEQEPIIEIPYVVDHPQIDGQGWRDTTPVEVSTYWSGDRAPVDRRFEARLLWSDEALLVRFEAAQTEPLVVSAEPIFNGKTIGLWERDVCEIFIAPDRYEPRKYFEFEVAPTGEWLDLALDMSSGERVTDWEYVSGIKTTARIEPGIVTLTMLIPWWAFGQTPQNGDVWMGNLFRCVGSGLDRGYLAWRPTLTGTPNFHVPEKFGEFRFVD